MTLALLHTSPKNGEWRILVGLVLRERTRYSLDKERRSIDGLCLCDGSLHYFFEIEHIDDRISAHAYVPIPEAWKLEEDVRADYARRRLWHEAIADLDRLKAELNWPSKPATDPTVPRATEQRHRQLTEF